MQVYQRTLASEVEFSGIGLHTGKKVSVRLVPAPPDSGIVFIRTDVKGSPSIKATPKNLSRLYYATNLTGENGVSVQTVEHLMAALSAFGIDNLYVYINSEELPILDGSAAPYVYLFEECGVQEQKKKRKYALLKREVLIEFEDKRLQAEPYREGLLIDNTISFEHPFKPVRFQRIVYEHTLQNFREIAKARTFCFYGEVEALRAAGLAKGGSLENAIVIDENGILNEGGLRLEKEFVAHKTLDLVGDLYILGYPLLAKITAFKTGHALNAALVKEIYFKKLYELVELPDGNSGGRKFSPFKLPSLEPRLQVE